MVSGIFVLAVTALLVLLAAASVSIQPTELSRYELNRRKRSGEKAGIDDVRRMEHFVDLVSLQRVTTSLLLVMTVLLLVGSFGWVFGTLIAVIVALQYGSLARLSFIRKLIQPYYDLYEPAIITLTERYPKVFMLLRNLNTPSLDQKLHSRDELLHLISTSGVLLDTNEKSLISHGMSFGQRRVDEVMTPRSVIDSVKLNEILGPLVLDDLHKTGHSRFPVIDGDLDHIVGILMLRDVLHVDSSKKHTAKVESAMNPKVYYVRDDQLLDHALAAFLKTHHHLFVVVNEYRETVGLLSLEDVLETLLGRKIIDKFDAHDDLRVVAERNPRSNNIPQKHTDV